MIDSSGIMKYVQQVALLRTVGHFKYAYVRFEIVSMSQDLDEGRITVRWRIAGISGLRVSIYTTQNCRSIRVKRRHQASRGSACKYTHSKVGPNRQGHIPLHNKYNLTKPRNVLCCIRFSVSLPHRPQNPGHLT